MFGNRQLEQQPERRKQQQVTVTFSDPSKALIEELIDAVQQGGNGGNNTKLDTIIELLKGGNLVPEVKLMDNKLDQILDIVTGDVQAEVDKFTSQLKTGTDELDAAVKANQPRE